MENISLIKDHYIIILACKSKLSQFLIWSARDVVVAFDTLEKFIVASL